MTYEAAWIVFCNISIMCQLRGFGEQPFGVRKLLRLLDRSFTGNIKINLCLYVSGCCIWHLTTNFLS